jgi:hypothetical protein
MAIHKLFDITTGEEIAIGAQRITSRGERVIVTSFAAPHHQDSTGRVYVKFIDNNETTASYFPGVINAKIVTVA